MFISTAANNAPTEAEIKAWRESAARLPDQIMLQELLSRHHVAAYVFSTVQARKDADGKLVGLEPVLFTNYKGRPEPLIYWLHRLAHFVQCDVDATEAERAMALQAKAAAEAEAAPKIKLADADEIDAVKRSSVRKP